MIYKFICIKYAILHPNGHLHNRLDYPGSLIF